MATPIPIIPANYQSSTQLFPAADTQAVAAAADMYFINNGITAIFVQNTNMATCTVTVSSVPDAAGRGGPDDAACNDLEVEIGDGSTNAQIVQIGPLTPIWWNQPNGVVLVSFDATTDVTVIGIQYA